MGVGGRKMKSRFGIEGLVKTAIVAALYGVITWSISFLSFGPIQLRITEVMVLLAFIDSAYIPGLILGCVIANLFSPFGIVDVIIGSAASFIGIYAVSKTKNLFLATLWPAIANGLIIGAELYYIAKIPFFIAAGEVALGEFLVVTCMGYPLFKYILRNNSLVNRLKFKRTNRL